MFGDPTQTDGTWNNDYFGNLLTIVRGASPRPIQSYITEVFNSVKVQRFLTFINVGNRGVHCTTIGSHGQNRREIHCLDVIKWFRDNPTRSIIHSNSVFGDGSPDEDSYHLINFFDSQEQKNLGTYYFDEVMSSIEDKVLRKTDARNQILMVDTTTMRKVSKQLKEINIEAFAKTSNWVTNKG